MTRLRILLLAIPVLAACGAARAASMSGDYQITLNTVRPVAGTETYCLSLNEDGSVMGWQHSGTATIANYVDGQFILTSHALVATLGFHGAGFTFVLPVRAAQFGPADFVAMNQGEIVESGTATAGAKGSCTPA